MGTRMSGHGWTWNVDEAPDEVQATLDDGRPHVFVPHTVYRGGHEVAAEPVILSIGDVTMLADNSA